MLNMDVETPLLNKIAFGTLLLAKACGISTIIAAIAQSKILTVGLLISYGLLLMVTVIICLVEMKRQRKQDNVDKDALERMMSDGTLRRRLAEIGYR